MKKAVLLISILMLGLSGQAAGKIQPASQKRYITPEEVHVTVSQAALQKRDALYESVRKAYAQGKLTADGVVDKALYHKVWSPEVAERCLRLVSDKNNRAKAELGLLYTNNKTAYLFPGKEAEGVTLLESASRAGNKNAADYLGIYYNSQKNYDKARQYFEVSAPDNLPQALTVIGEMYAGGHGFKKDRSKAIEYYKRAANLGDKSGAAKCGSALQSQSYGKVNMPDAFFWSYIAGELGDDITRSNLQLPLRGERFGDDQHTAFILNSLILGDSWNSHYGKKIQLTPIYQEGFKAGLSGRDTKAENGDEWSLFYLGSMSYNDEFLNRNDELVSKCYQPIIASGKLPKPALALVYERMADLYRQGKGVKADAAKAAEYDRKAANYGSLAAYKRVEKIPE